MKDGHTRKLARSEVQRSLFLARYSASLVVLEGPAAGNEHVLDREHVSLGRGPGVDLVFADDAMSREHAVLELQADGYRLRDLGSTNGLRVNGSRVSAADLKHADRIEVGEHVLQYVVERRERVGTYDLSDS
jgi:pSer/pThr/pTyr-binding forkhead associated (FHA) protein